MRDKHKVIIDKEKCIRCGLCISDCHANVICMNEDGAKVVSDECLKCGHCVAICPTRAVDMTGFEDELLEITEDMRIDSEIFLKQMKARRSVRRFTDEEVSKEDIMKIIEAGRYSPTAVNTQGVSYVVIKNNIDIYEKLTLDIFKRVLAVAKVFTNKLDRLEVGDNFLFRDANVVIVVKSKSAVDGGIAASAMEIMTQSLGLGVYYSGLFAHFGSLSPTVKKMLKLKRGEKIVTALVIGHPNVKYRRTAPKEKAVVFND